MKLKDPVRVQRGQRDEDQPERDEQGRRRQLDVPGADLTNQLRP
jgi:hypothetical protein